MADIDSARGVILVRHGKDGKDRNVMGYRKLSARPRHQAQTEDRGRH